jgi:AcrR family transcriptional regulator
VSGRARTGRRPGASDTRQRILGAARTSFGEVGFEGTTIRGVAAAAGVDPALVHHYFGTKQRLFVAAMEFPAEVALLPARLGTGPPGEVAERLLRFVLDQWESPELRPLIVGLVRSAATDPTAAAMLRGLLVEGPFRALADTIGSPDAALRTVLAGTQMVGLAMARYVLQVEPLASADHEQLVRAVAPTIERYLAGDLAWDEPVGSTTAST